MWLTHQLDGMNLKPISHFELNPQHGVLRGLHSTPLLQDWKVNVWIILTEMKD